MFLLYPLSHLEEFTQKVYENIEIYDPTALNPYTIADSLNIGLYPIASSSQAVQYGNRKYIFLNNTLSSAKQFEEFGHELGHLLLHTDQQHISPNYRAYQEWRADLFALHFCIPTFMLLDLHTNDFNHVHISKLFNVTLPFAEKRLSIHQQRLLNCRLYNYQL